MGLSGKVIIAYVILLLPLFVCGQGSLERSALKNLQKHKWTHAHGQIRKSLAKDTLNPTARFLLAQYFFSPQNPAFNIDSAYRQTVTSLQQYRRTSARDRDQMKRLSLDSTTIIDLKTRIDSAAFVRARHINTEQGYLLFISAFPTALQREDAEGLRDEAAFKQVLKKNTYQAFAEFISKYPQAARMEEARAAYERLLYAHSTSDQRLSSYERFVSAYPESSYRRDAERHVFELSTAPGTTQALERYLAKYPQSYWSRQARDVLYHLLLEDHVETSRHPLLNTDSIQQVARLNKSYLLPFLRNDKFGFMDDLGVEIIPAQADGINEAYLCGNLSDDVLALDDKLIARNGAVIVHGKIREVDELDYGFLKITIDNCSRVMHKTGFFIGTDCYEDAQVLQGRLIAVKKSDEWQIFSLTGRKLHTILCDDISTTGAIVLLKHGSKYKLTTVSSLIDIIDEKVVKYHELYDDVRNLPGGYILAVAKDQKTIFDQQIRVIIKPVTGAITSAFFGFNVTLADSAVLYDKKGRRISSFQKVEVQDPWVAVQNDDSWKLFDPFQNRYASAAFDSIRLYGPFAVGIRKDSITVHLRAHNKFRIAQPVKGEFFSGQDSTSYFVVHHEEKKSVFDTNGKRLFTAVCDRLQYAGNGFFIVTKNEKKGLVNEIGKLLLKVEYDGVGAPNARTVSLLKSMKFGLFNYSTSSLIKPEYEKNIIPYSPAVLIAFKSGAYGFIDWKNTPLSKFEFAEIQHWNDTIALVRRNSVWAFYNLRSQSILIDDIRKVSFIRNTERDKLAIIQTGGEYGVLSSTQGTVIPPRFSDIVNVGSAERPMYFTEKHVEEARLFVVIYYNSAGELVRREVYEPDDYDRIYCSGK